MDLRSMLNPDDGAAAAAAAVAAQVQAQAQAYPHAHAHAHAHAQAHPQQTTPSHLKTPQRTVSLAHPSVAYNTNSHSPPPVADKVALPRTTSLPAQVNHYRRESSASVSPKTMPPPAPIPYQTPSPAMSRKRSLSISDHQQTPQPVLKRRKYDPKSPPPWARRERDGHRFILTPRSDPSFNTTPQPPAQAHQNNVKQGSAPPATPVQPPHISQPPPQHGQTQEQGPKGLEPSLDDNEPYNEFDRQVCDFLYNYIFGQSWQFTSPTKLEVEAKLGMIKDWDIPHERLRMPIKSDVILDPNGRPVSFESSMKTDQHARLNKYLNSVTQQSQRPGRVPIEYKHTRETDYFYDIPTHALKLVDPLVMEWHNGSGKRSPPRLRVTRNNATNEITAVIIKTRVRNIEVRCPNDEFDYRVSISLESQWPHPGWEQYPEHLDQGGVRTQRNKDRLSYQHQGFLVDLTQVTPFARQGEKAEKIHELEIEMDVDRLVVEGQKMLRGERNDYERLVHVFLNNVKVVNRAAKAPPPQGQPMR